MTTASMARFCSTTASTKRSPAAVSGKIGEPETEISRLSISPLMPLDPELQIKYEIRSPRVAYQTFTDGSPDVEMGDILVVSGTEYPIRAVAKWPTDNSFLMLIVEEIQ